jgi:hypothetical protein
MHSSSSEHHIMYHIMYRYYIPAEALLPLPCSTMKKRKGLQSPKRSVIRKVRVRSTAHYGANLPSDGRTDTYILPCTTHALMIVCMSTTGLLGLLIACQPGLKLISSVHVWRRETTMRPTALFSSHLRMPFLIPRSPDNDINRTDHDTDNYCPLR